MNQDNTAHAKKLRLSHLMIDALVAAGEAQTLDEVDRDARSLVLDRLSMDDLTAGVAADGQVRLDLTPLVFGALDLMMWLARTLADEAQSDTLAVLADLRQQAADWQQDAGLLDDPPTG